MFKKTSKLLSLFFLLLISFVYTDKVFKEAKLNDPIMKEVISYKENNDIKPVEPIIKDDEIVLGFSGIIIDENKSYKKMKENDKFDKKNIVYENKFPNTTISKTYEYYIRQGNPSKKNVAIIFKVKDSNNIDSVLSLLNKNEIKANFFVDGAWLEKNVSDAFNINEYGNELYNLGYNGTYDKTMINVTNNLIESITLKDSLFCLNENKNDSEKEICKKKKMHTIYPTIINPTLIELKEKLVKGAIISYDLEEFDYSTVKLIKNIITSRGYTIEVLSKVVSE